MEKAKSHWLEEGDANTRFFHLSTIIHRQHNFMHYILDYTNSHVHDYDQIGYVFVQYYTILFSSYIPSFPSDL